VSALLATSAAAFSAVKVAGALYLLWLAVSSWRGARTAGDEPLINVADPVHRRMRRPFSQGFLVGALNPKTAIFFLAFLPQFADPARGSVAGQVMILGLLFIVLACVPDFTWAIGAGKVRHRLARLHRRVVDRVSAVVYAALAALVTTANRAST
jgi:threonine/homoserine/homoserine lactone efflux protein